MGKQKINHNFFGELDLVKGLGDENDLSDGVIVLWEKEHNGIMVTLWYDSGYDFKVEVLDTFTEFLNNHEKYLGIAKESLEKYLQEDDYYIVFHKQDLELDIPNDPTEFVGKMKANAIGLWLGENIATVDFMVDPYESDEILCVNFNDKLEVEDIAWES